MPEPQNVIPIDDLISAYKRGQRESLGENVDWGLQQDPDKAARADKLGKATGENPKDVLVNPDIEAAHRSELAKRLIENDPFLRQYTNKNPMATSVSNDDWGALANYSKKVTDLFPEQMRFRAAKWWEHYGSAYFVAKRKQFDIETQAFLDVKDFVWEGIKGVGYGIPHALGYGALSPASETAIANRLDELRAKGRTEEQLKQAEALWRSHYRQSEAVQGLLPIVFGAVPGAGIGTLAGGFAIPTAIPGAVRGVIARPLEEVSGIPKETSEHYINTALMALGIAHGVYLHNIKIPLQDLQVLGGRVKALDAWVEAGKIPPTGADAIIDRLKARAALNAEQKRKDVEREAQQSQTRERAPDIFAQLHADNPNVGPFRLSFDAVNLLSDSEKLKLSEAIPDLQLQLRNGEYTGQDIEVPVGRWNAHYYPEVAEKLHEHIRITPDDLTIAEAKLLEERAKVTDAEDQAHGAPITQYRSMAEDIDSRLPPVAPGYTRLWRGNRPGEVGENPAFSSDLPGIALPFRAEYGGPITYVDVPTGQLEAYRSGAGATDVEYLLPKVFYENAKVVDHEPSLMTAMRRAAGLHNVPLVELPEGAKPLFEKGALGLPKPLYDRIIKNRAKQVKEDQEFQRREAERVIKQEKTKQWKEDYNVVHEEVWADLAHDPFWALSRFFHDGVLPDGTKVPGHLLPKIGREFLTPAQRASMPHLERRTLGKGKGGINPDDIAGMFGYKTGVEIVDDLIKLELLRGKEGPKEFFERRVKMEARRRMERQYGKLPDLIEQEVQDHISGGTPLEALEERLFAAAIAAGHEGIPFSLADMKNFAAEAVGNKIVTDRLFDDYLADSGRAYNKFAEAASKGDWTTALKAAQEHYMAMLHMREAKLVQKTQKEFGKVYDRYIPQREVEGVPHLFTAHVHNILERLGLKPRRGPDDIRATLNQYGEEANLQKFYESRNYDANGDAFGLPKGWTEDEIDVLPNMPVWKTLREDPLWTKPMDQLTVKELRAITETLIAIDHVGRTENAVIVAGEAKDLKRTIDGLVEQMEKHPDRPGKTGVIRTHLRAGFAGLTPVEHFFNRLDWDNPAGVFTRNIWTPIIRAANNVKTLQREFSKHFSRIMAPDAKVNLNELIPNYILYEPSSMRPDPETGLFTVPKVGAKYRPITRKQMRVIALNSGTNWEKLIRGFGLDPKVDGPRLEAWLHQHMTPRDWQYVKDVWDMYKEIGRLEDKMMMELAGIPVRKLPSRNIKIQTIGPMFGQEIEGGYYPINYDRSIGFGPTDKPLERNYNIRAMTPNGHEKERTGYIGPLSLDSDHMVTSVGKRLHNIAMRNVVVETGKIFNNEYFKRVMTDKFGKEWTDLLPTYLRDIAGQNGMVGPKWRWLNDWIEYFRVNTVGSLIGWQPSTPMKHAPTAYFHSWREVGADHFLRAQRDLYFADRATVEANDAFIMKGGKIGSLDWKGSEELQNRIHMWEETLAGAHEIGMGAPLKWTDVYSRGATMSDFMKYARQANLRMGASVVARTDLVSAKIVWLAQYRKTMDELGPKLDLEEAHTTAVDHADRAVRRAHGSTALVNRPELLRGNSAMARAATSLYSFFNSTLMRSWRIFWKSRQIIDKIGADDVPRPELAMEVGKDIVAYWMLPIIIEQLVTPLWTPSEDKPPTTRAIEWGMAGFLHLSAGQIPILRELVHGMITGHEPTFGILGSSYKPFIELAKYLTKHPDAEHGGELIEGLIGVSTIMFGAIPIPGLPAIPASAQVGKWARGTYNHILDYEPPPSEASEWYYLFRRGTINPPRH